MPTLYLEVSSLFLIRLNYKDILLIRFPKLFGTAQHNCLVVSELSRTHAQSSSIIIHLYSIFSKIFKLSAISAFFSSVSLFADAGSYQVFGSGSTTAAAVGTNEATVNGITYGGFAGNNPLATVSVGSEGKERTITNVAAGRISKTSTDAINGSQLYAALEKNTIVNNNNTYNINRLENKMNRENKRLRAGVAGATATAGLPQAYTPGKSMVAAAVGGYRDQSALAVGASRITDNGKVILKLTGNVNTRGDFGGSVGAGYQW